ncbi:non-ribosomal peptide synthetase [Pseudoalteromonas rubra]|uniref:Carrier domain-containing protein n=1 Tax=Pseudoalteromonas rubra TaxID=43658 RepID=A0A0F4QHF2_9GAMM|nr:non-ribosomal peptide synthetase [Pseudoalteromonas rubra]KJZ06715.1 hypothetical protein TW77_18080 [Pseudoalteromonas rubra]
MSVLDILSTANQAGVELYLKDGQLAYRAKKAALSNDLKEVLKLNKKQVIDYLSFVEQLRADVCVASKTHELSSTHFALSSSQKSAFFAMQKDKASYHLNMPMGMDLEGEFSVSVFNDALNALIERHKILKTHYVIDDSGVAKQVVKPGSDIKLRFLDISDQTDSQKIETLSDIEKQESVTPFDLTCDYMVRGIVVKCAPKKHSVFITLHHIAADDWSIGIFKNELSQIYNQLTNDTPVSLPDLPVQYLDYAVWQDNMFQKPSMSTQLEYWQRRLDSAPMLHSIPLDKPRGTLQNHEGSNVINCLDISALNALKSLARSNGVTLFSMVSALFNAFLHRYTGQDDLVIGVPVANRDKLSVSPLVGFFVNMLPVRSTLEDGITFASYLKQYQDNLLSDFEYQHVPFNMIVESLGIPGGKAHNPLFQLAIVMGNSDIGEISFAGATSRDRELEGHAAKYDLALRVGEGEEGLRFIWEYATALFEEASIIRMSHYFTQFIDAVMAHMDHPVEAIPLVGSNNINCVEANQQGQDSQSVIDVFLHVVNSNPKRLALCDESSELTYQDIHERSNQVAYKLRTLGVKLGSVVSIELPKSVELFISVLGVLKAGAAYLPIDPSLPELRKVSMIEQSQVSVAITSVENESADHYAQVRVVTEFQAMPARDLPNINSASMAYVLYTSGSTGQPKGVMIGHSGIVNLAKYQQSYFAVSPDSKVLQFASFSFDASVWEWCMALLNGACLYVCSERTRTSPDRLTAYLQDNQITHATIPPSVLSSMNSSVDFHFKALIVAGEKCSEKLAHQWCDRYPFFNAYGPTETTVCATVGRISKLGNIHIGKAIDGFEVMILDRHQNPVPDGAVGELYIAGVGVAIGYINNPVLTRERFVIKEFNGIERRLYRSGDLVRVCPDGQLEFINRVDEQVKIRGVRIELGEIEQQLMQNDSVRLAKAIVHNTSSDNAEILAFVTLENQSTSKTSSSLEQYELENHLSRVLPNTMLPSMVIEVEDFPLTRNGKVDTNKLIEYAQMHRLSFSSNCETQTELTLRDIWSEITGTAAEQIGRNSNFYHVGGNSLLITKMLISIEQHFDVRLEIVDVISKQNLAEVSTLIDARKTSRVVKVSHDYQLEEDEMEILL